MNDNFPKIPQNIVEKCGDLWSFQKKLKQLLSQYGTYLETLRINPHNEEACKSILALVNDINDVGKKQNILMKEWLGSVVQLSEKYSSNKSLLLENFRNALIRQQWGNAMKDCSDEKDEDVVKILFLNQTNLIPEQLDKSINIAKGVVSNSVDVGNIRVICSAGDMFLPEGKSNGTLNLNKISVNEEKHSHNTVDIEPRCTRSSKVLLKRNVKDYDVQIYSKSRKKTPLTPKVPNTCCSLCKTLIFINEEQLEEHGKVICCANCTNRFYSESLINGHCNNITEDPVTPSDISSHNDTSQDTCQSFNS